MCVQDVVRDASCRLVLMDSDSDAAALVYARHQRSQVHLRRQDMTGRKVVDGTRVATPTFRLAAQLAEVGARKCGCALSSKGATWGGGAVCGPVLAAHRARARPPAADAAARQACTYAMARQAPVRPWCTYAWCHATHH
jgi:hypothetical protein